MQYLSVTKTPLVKRTPLGMYLCVPYGFQLESFFPIMEIDESVEKLLMLCDGQRTREEILQCLSKESGEPVEDIADGFDAFVEYMITEGVLEWKEESSFIVPLHQRTRPFSISFDITYECNLRCSFCSVDAGDPHEDELTLDDIIPFIEQVKQLKPSPLMINGGEPLLRKEMLLYILEQLSPVKEVVVPVLTNGTLIDEDYAQQLYDAGLQIGRVGIDGHTDSLHNAIRGKGSFEKALKGIRHLKELGIHTNVICVISRINYPYLREIKAFLETIADSFNISPVYPFGRAGPDLLLTQEEIFHVKTVTMQEKIETLVAPRNRCKTGDVIHIAANGDIFPCFYMQFPEYKVGTIKEDTLSDIYRAEVIQDVLKVTVDDFDQCTECDIRYSCGGGCRGFACKMVGSLYSPDPLDCESNKILVNKIFENGEENTKKQMQALIESTRNVG